MPNPRLAGRYAKSLIDLAIEKDELENVYQDMVFLHDICRSSREFVVLLKSPVVNADKKEKIVQAVTGGKIGQITQAFTKLLIHKSREFYLPEIAQAFIQQYKDHHRIHVVRLTTAIEVSEEIKAAIVNRIKKDADIDRVELISLVNKEIVGGFIVELDDKMMDASIVYELAKIRRQFESNDYIYKIG